MLNEKQKKENVWGWGIQDNLSYIQFLDNAQRISDKEGKPVFAMMATISHHMKFRDVPVAQRYLYKNPKSKKEFFLNSLHLSDKYLGTFIEELKKRKLYDNSIIILTGDHSFPAGEHGYYDNQASFYNEFFKVPLLIIWKDKITPELVVDKSASHVDIMPTIFDLIGEDTNELMVGESVMDQKNHVAHLVQPYNGIYLSAVKWPYKLVWERRSNSYTLYNLEVDADESQPVDNAQASKELKKEIGKIISNNDQLMLKD